jgi:ubiquinone/menaquinone biosynthesis C-methylase UbiE
MSLFGYGTLIDPLLRDLRTFTPEFSGMRPRDRVIDVCCGTGEQVLEYGRRGIAATGIDNDPAMLKVAARNSRRLNGASVSFQLADATALPFPDGCFDFASISMALHDKPPQARYKVVSEMRRVVRRDGVLVFIDFNFPLPRHPWAVAARAIEFIVGGEHYRGFRDYLDRSGMDDIMDGHGLREEQRAYLKSGLMVAVKAVNGSPD